MLDLTRKLIYVSGLTFLPLTPQKKVKYTQTICRLLPTNCLNVFDHFVGLALGLPVTKNLKIALAKTNLKLENK